MKSNRTIKVVSFLALVLGSFVPNAAYAAASFTSVAPMNIARSNHTATLLTTGDVLVCGGCDANGNALSSAELYNRALNTWTVTGGMGFARTQHTASLLSDGRLLVAGGLLALITADDISGGTALASAEVYDPQKKSWSAAGTLAQSRGSHTATVLQNGMVLVVGGMSGNTSLSSAELFNPATNSWSSGGVMSTPREFHSAIRLPSGNVVVAGGTQYGNGAFPGDHPLTSTEIYNPSTNSWAPAGSLSFGRYNSGYSILPSGKGIVIGGNNNFSTTYSGAEIYDAGANSWSGGGNMVAAREYAPATLTPDGQILMEGGGSPSHGAIASSETYNPSTNNWTVSASMSTVRTCQTATLLPDGTVLVAGGGDFHSDVTTILLVPTATAEIYNSGVTVSNVVSISSGNNQTASAGTAVANAISVSVTYQSGVTVVPGTVVTFAVASGGGSVTGGTAITNVNGIATLGSWTLGAIPGTNTLSVISGGSQALIITAAGIPGPPANITVQAGNGQSATVGTTVAVAPSVLVKDQAGNNVIDGTPVTFTVATGGGSVSGGSTTTSSGIATLGSWTLGHSTGANTLSVTCGSASAATFTATGTPGAPVSITITAGNSQNAPVGTNVPVAPSVRVQDQFGNNVVDGTQATFSVISGGGSVTGGTPTTSGGMATLGSWKLGTTVGSNSLKVISGAAQAVVTAFAQPGAPATISVLAGNNQSSAAGTAVAIPPRVTVQDSYANSVADGTVVIFAVASGGGTISGGNAPTSNGIAAVGNWKMGKATGTNTLNVTAGGAPQIVFTANSTPNTPPVIASGPTAAPSPAVVRQTVAFATSATDVDNEPLGVTWMFGDGLSGTGTTVGHSFAAPGLYTATVSVLDAVNPAVTGSVQVTVMPAVPLIGYGPDSDGDGFSDSFETAVGTNPNDASSTPTGQIITAANVGALTISKTQIKINFAKAGSDSITFSGTLSVPQGFTPFGAFILIDVGGIGKKLTLGAKGTVKQGNDSFKLALKLKKNVVQSNPSAKFTATFSKGSFAQTLATTSQLTNDDLKAVARPVTVTLIFNNAVQQKSESLNYTAKKGKSGTAK